jgi:hypothetical protein
MPIWQRALCKHCKADCPANAGASSTLGTASTITWDSILTPSFVQRAIDARCGPRVGRLVTDYHCNSRCRSHSSSSPEAAAAEVAQVA